MSDPKTIYDLALHEHFFIGPPKDYIWVRRVPGGWLYIDDWNDKGLPTVVFVPYSDEFKPAETGRV